MKTKRLLKFLIGVLGFSSMMVSCNKDDDDDGRIHPMYGVAPAEYKENIHQIDPDTTEQTLTVNDEEQSH